MAIGADIGVVDRFVADDQFAVFPICRIAFVLECFDTRGSGFICGGLGCMEKCVSFGTYEFTAPALWIFQGY